MIILFDLITICTLWENQETRDVSFVQWILLSSRGHKTEQHAWNLKHSIVVFHNTQTALKAQRLRKDSQWLDSVDPFDPLIWCLWRNEAHLVEDWCCCVSTPVHTVALSHHCSNQHTLNGRKSEHHMWTTALILQPTFSTAVLLINS